MRDVIVSAYNEELLTPTQIAQAYGLDLEYVKSVLKGELGHDPVD